MTLLLSISIYSVALAVIFLIVWINVRYKRDRAKMPSDILIICLAGFGISVVLNYPGFMSNDSVGQILQARNGIYSDIHPPLLPLLWHFTDRIIPGPFGMLLLQTTLIWLGTFLVTINWFKGTRFTILSLMPSMIIFYPPIFTISGAIWTDVLMWAFFTLAIGIAGTIEPSPRQSRRSTYINITLTVAMIFLGVCVRYNAVLAAVPIMTLCILRATRTERYLHGVMASGTLGTLLSLVFLFCVNIFNHSLTQYHTNTWAFSALSDISGIIYRMPDERQQQALYAGIPARLRCSGSLDRILQTYDPLVSLAMLWTEDPALCCPKGDGSPSADGLTSFDTTCFALTGEEKSSLLHLWATSVINHPAAWVSHRVAVFRRVIGLNNPWSPVFMEPNEFDEGIARIYRDRNPELNKLQRGVKWFFEGTSRTTWLYKPLVYLTLAIGVVVMCIAFLNSDRLQIALIALSGLAHEGGLFLIAPTAEYRFSHYMIYTSILAFTLFLRTFDLDKNSRTCRLSLGTAL